MSHSKIRTEKICLNCGTETPDRFCPNCGQQNIEPKQSVWQLIHHFFADITHFDGKFFETVKDLFAKPGFLSKEYMIGRRARYLDPVRMYIFTSAFFFLIFFSLLDVKKMHFGDENLPKGPDVNEILSKVQKTVDSAQKADGGEKVTIPFVKVNSDSAGIKPGLQTDFDKTDFKTIEAYDSVQKKLPASERDGWLKKRIMIRKIELNQRYDKERTGLVRDMVSGFLHNFPKMLFISLPLFALILKLLYVRRKEFYYVDHGIFAIHLYIFSFLVLLVAFGVNKLSHYWLSSLFQFLLFLILIYPFVYYYKAMHRFYGQSRGKTFLKFFLLFLLSFFVQLTIFVGFILFTVFEA